MIRYGQRRTARAQTANRAWMTIAPHELEQYVSEEHNPENAKSLTGVEIFMPAPLLASRMCFVDTPGVGSHDFIPHIDAAIIVVGADPPISGEELAIVEMVAKQVSDLLFVLLELAQPASPLRFTADFVLGLVAARHAIERDAHEFLDHLLETNAMRVQSGVDTRVGDGKSRLETDIRTLLHEVSAVAERALAHARTAQAAGASAVEGALAKLAAAEAEIRQLRPTQAESL